MLLQHGRAAARADAKGNPILLEHQDRSLWDRAQLEEGEALLVQALGSGQPGSYQLQAAIAALHAQAASYADTDWMQILLLYDRLLGEQPSPVVELNRAVALAMARGPAAGLQAVERLASAGDLQGYLYLHSTRAELLQRLGRIPEARTAYGRALELAENAAQQAFLRGRLEALPN
jgi:RNA polymerase sigma-70 factor (ECF subfamily)